MRTVRRLLTCVAVALAVAALFAGVRAEASTFVFTYQGGPFLTGRVSFNTAVAADGGGHVLVGAQYAGEYDYGTGSIVARSNGQSWYSFAGLDGGGADSTTRLTAVAHIGRNDDWASGTYYDNYGDHHESFFHYDGTQWRSVSSTLGGATSISGSGSNDVWAAFGGKGAAHWDGTAWTFFALPTSVNAVLDLSPTNVWAVGHGILHWNGTSWSAVAAAGHTFQAVSARSAFGVWAVGDAVYQYNGSRWRAMPTPAGLNGNELTSVSFLRSADIWTTDGPTLYHWGGTSWTAMSVNSLVPGASGYSTLTGLSGRPDTGELWAIGRDTGPFLLHRAPIYR